MGVNSSKGFNFRLMASGSEGYKQLDTFQDEEILVSDNVTGLFDLGVLPSDFTRQITIPGTKVNNDFFQHVYDISVEEPFLFKTNVKVPAYFDFDGIYISEGYLQLNKVNVYANKFVESYEISIYGGLSSFARDINRYYLTDLTSSLNAFNHTASYSNITSSWSGNLFSGSIVYPLAEYGQKIQYTPEEPLFGIDSVGGALCVQDWKPAIRIKEVWDAIFEQFGYTYSSSFWVDNTWLDNVYLLCNNNLKYPVIENYDLETYGLFKIGPVSGSGTDVLLTAGNAREIEFFNIQQNPSNAINSDLDYNLTIPSKLRGLFNLNFQVSSSSAGNGIPQFFLDVKNQFGTTVSTTELVNYNNYMDEIQIYNSTQTKTQTFELLTEFSTDLLPVGVYNFFIRYTTQGGTNFTVKINPNGSVKSYFQITKVNQGGDRLIMDIPSNMPFGTTGIKLIDFITSIQKKFNLIIYPNKTKSREFIVETFNNWYGEGETRDFNKYINLNEKIEVIPANNLAVNQLNFGDTLDGDYISQQFAKAANREYGKQYYVDNENFFSQGSFDVKTKLASSPIVYVSGTGNSGSAQTSIFEFQAEAFVQTNSSNAAQAVAIIQYGTQYLVQADAQVFNANDSDGPNYDPSSTTYNTAVLQLGDTIEFEAYGFGTSFESTFTKILDGVTTVLASPTSPSIYSYQITAADVAAGTKQFLIEVAAGDNLP